MSFSVCINCKTMVSCYEKYCPSCVRTFLLPQDVTWHKTSPLAFKPEEWKAEVERDKKK
jgi:hypothetical protein